LLLKVADDMKEIWKAILGLILIYLGSISFINGKFIWLRWGILIGLLLFTLDFKKLNKNANQKTIAILMVLSIAFMITVEIIKLFYFGN